MSFSCVTFLAPETSEIKCKVQCTEDFPRLSSSSRKYLFPPCARSIKILREGGEGALKSKIFKGNVKGAGENYKKKNVKMTKPAVQLAMTANLMASVVSYSITLSVFSHHVFV